MRRCIRQHIAEIFVTSDDDCMLRLRVGIYCGIFCPTHLNVVDMLSGIAQSLQIYSKTSREIFIDKEAPLRYWLPITHR